MHWNAVRRRIHILSIVLSMGTLVPLSLCGCGSRTIPDRSAETSNPVRVTGSYSNMQYNEEGGDLLGFELFIVLSKDGLHVLYQESPGEPFPPRLLPLTVNGGTIAFTLPPDDPRSGDFTGTVTAEGISGTFSSNNEHIVLKRKESYWH